MAPDKVKFTAKQILRELALAEAHSARSLDERLFNMTTLPTKMIKHVCEHFQSDVWRVMAISNEQIPTVFMSIKAIIEHQDSAAKKAMKTVSFIVNPYLAQAKQAVSDDNESKAAKFVSNHGIEVVTSIYGELYKQGVSLGELQKASLQFYLDQGKKESEIETLLESAELLRVMDGIKSKAKQQLVNTAGKFRDGDLKQDVSAHAKEVTKKASGFMKNLFG